jgi:hypothetical protein
VLYAKAVSLADGSCECCCLLKGFSFRAPAEQYQLPDAANRRLIPDRLNVSLYFTSSNLVVVSDGTGKLILLNTGDRREDTEWKVILNIKIFTVLKFLLVTK